ncbi:MAG: CHAT domain-containing protein [Cyanobacteria bacterium J06635_15]
MRQPRRIPCQWIIAPNRAKAVLASLWAVDDGGTSLLMQRFYGYMADGMTKADALQAAQLDLLREATEASGTERGGFELVMQAGETVEQASDRLSHPYYWAPFVLIGNNL